MSKIEWMDESDVPPAGGGAWVTFVAELKRRPGCWAKFDREFRNTNSAKVSCSRARKRFPGLEVRTREFTIYAMWPEANQ